MTKSNSIAISLTGYIVLPKWMLTKMPPEVTLSSVENTGHPNLPRDGITLLYGFTNAIQELAQIQRIYRDSKDKAFLNANVDVLLKTDTASSLAVSSLPNVEFMHIDRVRRETVDIIENIYRREMEKEGLKPAQIEAYSWKRTDFIGERPDLISKVREDKRFKHIELIVYPIINNKGERRYRGTLFSSKHLVSANILGHDGVKVSLPV